MNTKFVGTAVAAMMASSAYAGLDTGDTFTVSRIGISGGGALSINWDSSITSSSSVARSGGDTYVGGRTIFSIQKINDTAGSYGNLTAFCVELSEQFPDDPIQYTCVEPTGVPEESPPGNMSANQSALMQDLYARYWDDVNERDYSDESYGDFGDEAAAFQLVIWEISHESFSSTDLAGMASELSIELGAFQGTDSSGAAIATLATSMINSIGNGGFMGFTALRGGTNPNNQDLLIVVPSPAIAGLAGLGLVGMRRRRR